MKNVDDFRDELRVEFKLIGLSESDGINLLQGKSSPTVISDNCVTVDDIAESDLAASVKLMKDYPF